MEMTSRKRHLHYGANATLLTASVVLASALLYGIVDRTGWRFDSTANQEFSLSEQTRTVLKDLKEEVKVIAYFRHGDDLDDLFIRRKVDDVLKEYAARSPKVEYRLVDPDAELEETLQHQITMDGTILFLSGKNRKEVYRSQLFDYSQLTESSLPAFSGEGLFTNALLKVTQAKPSTLCFLEGHGERRTADSSPEGYSQAAFHLKNNNYELRSFSFVTEPQVPAECQLLVLAGRRKKFLPEEERRLRGFVQKGKALLLLEEPFSEGELTVARERLGVSLDNNLVLDPDRHFLLGPHFPAPILSDHEVTRGLQQMNPILSLARSLKLSEAEKTGIALLTTTDKSWGETDFREGKEPRFDAGPDQRGPLTLAWALEKNEEKGKERGRAIVVGDADFASNGLIQAPGNLDLFLNMVGWLTGEKGQIGIHPKTPEFRNLSLTAGQARFIGYFSQIGYPLLILGAGGTYWFRRRRR